jgi:hypothetical protein
MILIVRLSRITAGARTGLYRRSSQNYKALKASVSGRLWRNSVHYRDLARVVKQELGVDASVVPADPEEQVRSRGAARRSDPAERLALLDPLSGPDLDLGEV